MNKVLLTCFSLTMCLLLGACANTQAPADNAADPAPEPQPNVVETVEELETTGDLLCEHVFDCEETFTMLHYYIEESAGEAYYVWCDEDMTNVEIVQVEYVDDGLVEQKTLQTFDTILAGEAIHLGVVLPEGVPYYAIRYTVGDETRTCIPQFNGRDGGFEMIQATITPAPAKKPEAEKKETAAEQKSESTTSESKKETSTSEKKTETKKESDGFRATIYSINDIADDLIAKEKTIESSSAWHIWAALKRANPDIPIDAGLNSYKIVDNIGYLNLKSGIYKMKVGGGTEAMLLHAIANTYIENTDAYYVAFLVDGEVYESGHFYLDEPYSFTTVF